MLSKLASRAAVAAASLALVAVSACSFKADFFLTREFDHVVASSGSSFNGVWNVDLAAEAPGAWKRRDNVKSLDVVAVEATMVTNYLGTAAPASGTIVLSRAGLTDVTVGTWSHTIAATGPDTFDVTMPAAGNALIMDALRGDGKFTVKATATTTSAIDLKLKVTIQVGVNYDMKP
jgi:hypothetical protein